MIRRPTPRLVGYAAIVALGAYGAVTLDRIALLALIAPFAVWLAFGLATAAPPELEITSRLDEGLQQQGVGA